MTEANTNVVFGIRFVCDVDTVKYELAKALREAADSLEQHNVMSMFPPTVMDGDGDTWEQIRPGEDGYSLVTPNDREREYWAAIPLAKIRERFGLAD